MKLAIIGGPNGLTPIPDPPGGFGYLPVPLSNELLVKIQQLEGGGGWERDLSALLTEAAERFFATRAIVAKATPSPSGDIIKFYDRRDPLRHPLDRRPSII